MRTICLLVSTLVFLLCAPWVTADIALTGNCQDDARALQDEIRDNKDDYTAESRTRAMTELTAAKTNLVNPVKCRKNIQDARQALRKGKKDKKDKKDKKK